MKVAAYPSKKYDEELTRKEKERIERQAGMITQRHSIVP